MVGTDFEYAWYNNTEEDKKYFKDLYTRRGYRDVKVKRVKSDTKGIKMYQIDYKFA